MTPDPYSPQLSGAAQTAILDGSAPADYLGDGLIPGQNQKFPADLQPADGGIVTLENLGDDVLHIEEPLRHQELRGQLLMLVHPWFRYP